MVKKNLEHSDLNESEKTIGPIIGSLIIVIMLILGALYFWGQRLNSLEEQTKIDAPTKQTLHKSDDIQSIKKDLDATDVSTIDARVRQMK